MKNYQIGMFVEQNKNRLLPNDLKQAQVLLENASNKKINELLAIKTKSPIVSSIFATLLGWIGVDCFYLGQIKKGIGRLITTIVSIILNIGTFLLFDLFAGDIPIANMPTFVATKLKFDTIFVKAELFQYVALAIAILFAVTYVIVLIKNAVSSERMAKLVNKELYKLKCVVKVKTEELWQIG